MSFQCTWDQTNEFPNVKQEKGGINRSRHLPYQCAESEKTLGEVRKCYWCLILFTSIVLNKGQSQ